ncbi:MAG: LacI family transcriptional regulator [Bacteroidetes bacterium]|nr:LacI family transcriptional regulator [Bacteroidota bacterium]MCL6099776.1 LacI family transcriptional regulator [Bacteroidota bacterium]
MKPKEVTLNDIAQKLGVSIITVSKALRGHPDISSSTSELIKKAATELGYSPNLMARSLASRKSNTIGVVLPEIAHHFFSSIIDHIYIYATLNDYQIFLTVSQENSELQKKQIQTLLSMRVEGIIISISQDTSNFEIFETAKNKQVPLVFMDRIPDLDNCNTVTVDDRGGAYKAIDHAIKLGYKKIAHFAGYTNINIGRERMLGFKQAMNDYGLEVNQDWVLEGDFGEKSGYDSFMKLYHEKNLPDLILAVTYPVAIGIYMAAKEVGMNIPNDIDLICFGNSQEQNFLSPPLSCVNQPTEQLAAKSMEVLIENIIKKDKFSFKQIVVDTDLILRGTCIKCNRL